MHVENRHVMYKRYLDGLISEEEYKTYLVERELVEMQISEKFQETVSRLNLGGNNE